MKRYNSDIVFSSGKYLFSLLFCCFLLSYNAVGQNSAGMNKEKPGEAITVYPNPSGGKFTIKVAEQEKPFHINIYNLVGEMIFHWESGNSLQASFEADLSRRPEGIYFVELDTEKANVVKRIILERAGPSGQ